MTSLKFNPQIAKKDKDLLLRQLIWDYNISIEDIEAVLIGKSELAGHYTCDMIFIKMLESYSWFTILKLLTPSEVQKLLTSNIVNKLRTVSLRDKYEFVRQRLQEVIPITG